MSDSGQCPRCGKGNVAIADFCADCGYPISNSKATVGRVPHPSPLAVPDGFRAVAASADLYFGLGSAWGGKRLLTTENLGLTLLNVGYPLRDVAFEIIGLDAAGARLFAVPRRLPAIGRGERIELEIASYEIPDPPDALDVRLVASEYA